MATIRVILKSGKDINVVCENCIILKDAYGVITSYELVGVVENDPIYLDFSQVAAVIHAKSDEPSCEVRYVDEAAVVSG